ncbi:hypothetical protein BpHYR1_015765 [Brachionus plicatilis]|uniref:Uncharacterized protein n=1 Tax=Brachionus plicatilis TaxID=10195 RepID=A0A3M7Q8S0_BRAPC|nr:hypothetical protein BpHYR1_015765 [Brachionus plicatilis]
MVSFDGKDVISSVDCDSATGRVTAVFAEEGAFGKDGLCLARGVEQDTLYEYLLRGSVDLVEVPPTDTPVELLARFGSIFDRPPSYCFTLLQCVV